MNDTFSLQEPVRRTGMGSDPAPMILANAVGMYLFCLMVEHFRRERKREEAHKPRSPDTQS